jgi:hypothetical protein
LKKKKHQKEEKLKNIKKQLEEEVRLMVIKKQSYRKFKEGLMNGD